MNRLARAQGMSNDPVKLCAVIDINSSAASVAGRLSAARLRTSCANTHPDREGALHQNAVGHLVPWRNLSVCGSTVTRCGTVMGGGDPGAAFQPANHPAASDNCIHHIAKRPINAAALVRQLPGCRPAKTSIASASVNPQPHGERQSSGCGASGSRPLLPFAKVSPMPASRYFRRALRMMRGLTSNL